MNILQKTAFSIVFIALFSACEQKTNAKISLSKSETRKEIMDSIANNNAMSIEMIETMMNSKNGEKWLQENEKLTTMMRGNHGRMME